MSASPCAATFALVTWVIGLASVLSWGSALLLVLAVVTSVTRKWSLALRAARVCALVALGLVVVSVLVLVVGLRSPEFLDTIMRDVSGASAEPSQKARVLAQTISELMNATALGLVAGVLAVPIWIAARGRARKARV